MARFVFKLPDVGEGIAESEIATWRVKVGDTVAEDQPLVDMLTDKAAIEIPSPVAGVVVERHGEEGDKIAVGGPLLVIETEAAAAVADTAAAKAATPVTPAPATKLAAAPAAVASA
ncbi:MAG: biotin/lipoyl-containing protein, partial [Solimonas sp.]